MSCDSDQPCTNCCQHSKLLSPARMATLLSKLAGWQVLEGRRLHKEFSFPDFRTALTFTNHLGELAERVGHHPDIFLSWGKVQVEIWTHSKNGLTEADFSLAEQTDLIPTV
ncbi:MAG: 4a-hydroxytetrahydrobiopterin dehydratase [Oligoflexia bacterium]|nr:4a-hydroxytetrahydrobiopterin dehydratase [Oligoflexia bacterium]